MDGGDSLLDQACVRVALLPVGGLLTEERFEELASYVTSWREIALSILPRRNVANRSTFSTSASGNATYSHLPSEFRVSSAAPDSATFLSRTFSARSETARSPKRSPASPPTTKTTSSTFATPEEMAEHFAATRTPSLRVSSRRNSHRPRRRARAPIVPDAALSLEPATVDSLLRLRYDLVHRAPSGEYALRATSNWDSFHSRRVWGVIGIADLADAGMSADDQAAVLAEAQAEFAAALAHFPSTCVSRVVAFTTPDAAHRRGASVMDSPSARENPADDIVFGYVPESTSHSETRQEVRVQVIHFSELLLNALDRESWRMEKSTTNFFLTPLDEPATPDKHPKLLKRRPGRLDKLLADNLLLMGAPADALVKYNSAVEKARANSDRLWLAGAMECWATAHILTYVKAGGAVTDPTLTNKLIEHFSEVYKLYSKKRVAELEAGAALRLAEFLGQYTHLRREALEAAGHAADVGENLPSVKRATLWEALAKFSSFMKCHRKAAFYLYRVGSLCAAKSVWSSSEALLTASAREFKLEDGRIWPDLHRSILLEAAKAAWELGDPFLATQHYTEALSLSAFTLKRNTESDTSLVKLLMETTTPPYLPAAPQLLKLQRLTALQLPLLIVKAIVDGENKPEHHAKAAPTTTGGPFIYDPFKERALRKAAAVASRAVTWVCGEAAHVSMRIQNQTHTELPVEIIAVAIVDSEKRMELWPAEEKKKWEASKNETQEGSEVEEHPQVRHAKTVKSLLQEVTNTVDTMSETVLLPPRGSSRYTEKTVSVYPRKTGAMHICGLIVRMFRGTIVLLPTPEPSKEEISAPPIKVLNALPQLSVSIRQDDGELSSLFSSSKPVVIFEGERRCFSVRIENIGKDDIRNPSIRVTTNNSGHIEVSEVGRGYSQLNASHLRVGNAYDFVVEVAANNSLASRVAGDDELPKVRYAAASINVIVEYTGVSNKTMSRQSSSSVALAVTPAIRISSLSMFKLPLDGSLSGSERANDSQSRFGLVLDVENLVPVPLMIALPPAWQSPDIFSGLPGASNFGMSTPCPAVNVLENGATTRLITAVPNEFFDDVDMTGTMPSNLLSLSWAIPGVGRNGVTELSREHIVKARASSDFFSECTDALIDGAQGCMDLRLKILDDFAPSYSYKHGAGDSTAELAPARQLAMNRKDVTKLEVCIYYKCTVVVFNRGASPFPNDSTLDLNVLQHDGRGNSNVVDSAALIGAVEGVRIGALQPGSTFEHPFKVRFTSAGLFELSGVVHQLCKPDTNTSAHVSDGWRWGVTVNVTC